MSPVIVSAIIAASATGTVAIVGFLVTGWTTTRALRAARDQRLWDKRAEVYAEILAYVGHRKDTRQSRLGPLTIAPDAVRRILGSYQRPTWYPLQGQVLAFASEEVGEPFQKGHHADERVWLAWQERAEKVEAAKADPVSADPQAVAALADKIKAARDEADRLDNALVSVIRKELQPQTRRWRRLWSTSLGKAG